MVISTAQRALKRQKTLRRLGALMTKTPFLSSFQSFKRPLRQHALAALEDLVQATDNAYRARTAEHTSAYTILPDQDMHERLAEVKRLIADTTEHDPTFHGRKELRNVQLTGVLAGLHGYAAQINTGEGKTLTAAAYALMHPGQHVDIFCSNRKLAERDYREMRPIYEAAGKTVALNIPEGDIMESIAQLPKEFFDEYFPLNKYFPPTPFTQLFKFLADVNRHIGYEHELNLGAFGLELEQALPKGYGPQHLHIALARLVQDRIRQVKQKAYCADVLYTTIDERIFDYEKDNTSATSVTEQVQTRRQRQIAIIDEADENMVDDAVSPKIISSVQQQDNQYKKDMLVRFHERILTPDFYVTTKDMFGRNVSEHRYFHRHLINLWDKSQPIQKRGARWLAHRLIDSQELADIALMYGVTPTRDANALAKTLHKALRQKSKQLKKTSRYVMTRRDLDRAFTSYASPERARQALDDMSFFINALHQAHTSFAAAGQEAETKPGYFVDDKGEIKLLSGINAFPQKGRKLSHGLHTAIEVLSEKYKARDAQGNVCTDLEKLSDISHVQASIANTHFFQGYKNVLWTSGSLEDVDFITEDNYGLPLMVIPSHKPKDPRATWAHVWANKKTFSTIQEKYTSITHDILGQHFQYDSTTREHVGRPIFIRVESPDEARVLAAQLIRAGVCQENMRTLSYENENDYETIIAHAGKLNRITFVTDMGCRGADIKLDERVHHYYGDKTMCSNEPEHTDAEQVTREEVDALQGKNTPARHHKYTLRGAGLCTMLTSFSEDRRSDIQAIGRGARQGEPGEAYGYLSVQDAVVGQLNMENNPLLPGLIHLRRYMTATSKHQQINRQKQLNIDAIVDTIYAQRQVLLEQKQEVTDLETLDDVRAYMQSPENQDKLIMHGLHHLNPDVFSNKTEFNKALATILAATFEQALDKKESLDADIDDIYHYTCKSALRRNLWDPAYKHAWAWVPTAYTAIDAAQGDFSIGKTIYLAAMFGLPQLYQHFKMKGMQIHHPMGMPHSRKEPNGIAKTFKSGFQNMFYVFWGVGAAATALTKGAAAIASTFPPVLAYYATGRVVHKIDESRVKKAYARHAHDIFANSLDTVFKEGAGHLETRAYLGATVTGDKEQLARYSTGKPERAFIQDYLRITEHGDDATKYKLMRDLIDQSANGTTPTEALARHNLAGHIASGYVISNERFITLARERSHAAEVYYRKAMNQVLTSRTPEQARQRMIALCDELEAVKPYTGPPLPPQKPAVIDESVLKRTQQKYERR